MTALVRNIPEAPKNRKVLPERAVAVADKRNFGFGIEAERAHASGELGGAALTILLVLYPAVASVAVVLASFMLSGAAGAA
ncbi:hypothetical protein ACSBOB_26150 [Mesorhizobium sp. ASY16-5R]|uniref:hypothetical protein n=1 Tax=Mesorhizobium sp. ASY16-5R TaxID=3445772 RepID=UPI003FA09E94